MNGKPTNFQEPLGKRGCMTPPERKADDEGCVKVEHIYQSLSACKSCAIEILNQQGSINEKLITVPRPEDEHEIMAQRKISDIHLPAFFDLAQEIRCILERAIRLQIHLSSHI